MYRNNVSGLVFTNKKPVDLGGGLQVVNPVHGQTGWRCIQALGAIALDFEEVVFDKGGTGRKEREGDGVGGKIFTITAEWVSLSEFNLRKEARARYWKKSKGPAHFMRKQAQMNQIGLKGYLFPYGGACRVFVS